MMVTAKTCEVRNLPVLHQSEKEGGLQRDKLSKCYASSIKCWEQTQLAFGQTRIEANVMNSSLFLAIRFIAYQSNIL